MKTLLLLTLLVGLSSQAQQEDQGHQEHQDHLLFQYESLIPYHQNLQVEMPHPVCQEGQCSLEWRPEDNSQSIYALLSETEGQHDVEDPLFRQSRLGRFYWSLKNFMAIQEGQESCLAGAEMGTQNHLDSGLERLSRSASAQAMHDTCHPEWTNFVSLKEHEELAKELKILSIGKRAF